MVTNVYCDFCEKEVGSNDSFVVDGEIVRAYHYTCGRQITDALFATRGRESMTVALEPSDLAPLERRVQRIEAVWKLWISEAESGRISQATFHTMKHLLGMDKA